MLSASHWFLAPTMSSCAVMIEIEMSSRESTKRQRRRCAVTHRSSRPFRPDDASSGSVAWVIAELVDVAHAIRDVVSVGPHSIKGKLLDRLTLIGCSPSAGTRTSAIVPSLIVTSSKGRKTPSSYLAAIVSAFALAIQEYQEAGGSVLARCSLSKRARQRG
jgi:hypothetical protein